MSKFDINAYNKLNTVFEYARDLKVSPNARGGDSVVRLQGDEEFVCSYSTADAPRGLLNPASRRQDQKDLNNATRAIFRQAVIEIFGTSINDVPKNVRSAMNLSDYDCGKPLTARRIIAVNKAIDVALKAIAKTLGITGGAATEIASAIAKKGDILNGFNSVATYKERVNQNATSSMKVHIATEMAKVAKNAKTGKVDTDPFDADLMRGMGLTVGGKRITSRDPVEARDRLVQFLTGDKHATFATASEDVKKQVKVLTTMLHQGTFACILPPVSYSFDENSKNAPFAIMEGLGSQTNSFSVSKGRNGEITIKAVVKYSNGFCVNMGGMAPKFTGNDGSYAKFEAEIKIPSLNLKWLAKQNWEGCPTENANAMMYNANIDNRFNGAAEQIPENYNFIGNVNVSMKMHINAFTDNPPIQ